MIGVWVRLADGHIAYLEESILEPAVQLSAFFIRMKMLGLERLSDGRIVNRNYIVECGMVA